MALPDIHGLGRLTADASKRYTNGGHAVTTVNLAFNERRYNRDTQQWEDSAVCFLKSEAWRDVAEALGDLKKADEVVVVGHLVTETWTTQDGQSRSAPKLRISSIGVALRDRPAARATTPSEDPWGPAPDVASTNSDDPPF